MDISYGGITSSSDLDNWGFKNIPGFKGVVDKDKLVNEKFRPGDSYILNLDDETGTHWVALRVSTKKKAAMYIDSFGFPPADIVVRAAWKHKLPMYYSNEDRQKIDETNCGQRSLRVLYNMANSRNDWKLFKKLGG
jgi:hypothetical protein